MRQKKTIWKYFLSSLSLSFDNNTFYTILNLFQFYSDINDYWRQSL